MEKAKGRSVSRLNAVLVFSGLVVLASFLLVVFSGSPKEASDAQSKQRVLRSRMISEARGASAERISEMQGPRLPAGEQAVAEKDPSEDLSDEVKKLADELQKALDEDDFAQVQSAIEKVIASKNLFLLRRAVSAARCFGRKALPELTGLAAAISELAGGRRRSSASGVAGGGSLLPADAVAGDPADGGDAGGEGESQQVEIMSDEAQQALFDSMTAIEEQLNGMSDANEKAELLAAYMKASSSEDVLILLSGQLKTILDDGAVLGAVVDIIENGGSPESVVSAKDVYKFMTGADYSGVDAAQHWLDNDSIKPLQSQDAN